MGIVNVTPDSFSDGGRLGSVEAAVAHGLSLVAAGAGILAVLAVLLVAGITLFNYLDYCAILRAYNAAVSTWIWEFGS